MSIELRKTANVASITGSYIKKGVHHNFITNDDGRKAIVSTLPEGRKAEGIFFNQSNLLTFDEKDLDFAVTLEFLSGHPNVSVIRDGEETNLNKSNQYAVLVDSKKETEIVNVILG